MDKTVYIALIVSFVLTAVAMPLLIPVLHRLKFGQTIREIGPKWHEKKNGTPTMGGVCFLLISCIISFILCSSPALKLAISAAFLFGVIGFADDFIKIYFKRNLGLTETQKLIFQTLVAVIFLVLAVKLGYVSTQITIPFTNLSLNLSWFYIIFMAVFMVGFTNAVNLTDGLDGLAASVTAVVTLFFTVSAILVKNYDVSYFSAAVTGSLLGFLIYNYYPAKVFMGDTGSLFLGGVVSVAAILLKLELLLIIVGIIYVTEALSVIIQVAYFKKTRKRIFLMAPIHHHFEMKGLKEVQIVYIFSLITLICSAISLFAVI